MIARTARTGLLAACAPFRPMLGLAPRGASRGDRRVSNPEAGYSLVEVMASIVILTAAIIPMVGMFDAGLGYATRSGDYDAARAFANERLEYAGALSYDEVRDGFPVDGSGPAAGGSSTSSGLPVPSGAGLPEGASYAVEKRYVAVSPGESGAKLTEAGADSGLMLLTITVRWDGASYSASGAVADGTP